MLSKATIQAFAEKISGKLLQPGDPEYDEARKVYNGMIDRHPRLIARCNSVEDIVEGVQFARENDLLLAIRGGSHNAGGLGVCDDGLVLDISLMKGIEVEPCHSPARSCHPKRRHPEHRRSRADPGRRTRLPDAQIRPDH
jgi:FAD/FMN-containing dehydrogenase